MARDDTQWDDDDQYSSRDSDESPLLSYRIDRPRHHTYIQKPEREKRWPLTVIAKFSLFSTAMILFCVLMYIPVYNKANDQMPKVAVAGWSVHTNRDTKIYVQPDNVTTVHEPKYICPKKKHFLLIVVCSSTTNFERRIAIRQTWGNVSNYIETERIFHAIHEKYKYYNYSYDLESNDTDRQRRDVNIDRKYHAAKILDVAMETNEKKAENDGNSTKEREIHNRNGIKERQRDKSEKGKKESSFSEILQQLAKVLRVVMATDEIVGNGFNSTAERQKLYKERNDRLKKNFNEILKHLDKVLRVVMATESRKPDRGVYATELRDVNLNSSLENKLNVSGLNQFILELVKFSVAMATEGKILESNTIGEKQENYNIENAIEKLEKKMNKNINIESFNQIFHKLAEDLSDKITENNTIEKRQENLTSFNKALVVLTKALSVAMTTEDKLSEIDSLDPREEQKWYKKTNNLKEKRDISSFNQILPELAKALSVAMTTKDDRMLPEFDMNKEIGGNEEVDYNNYDYETNIMKIPPKGEENFDLDNILEKIRGNFPKVEIDFKVVFLLGLPVNDNSSEIQDKIDAEVEKYGDIIQEGFMDTYNNLTLKSIMMLKWVTNNCNDSVRYILKTDDDMYINVPNLITNLRNRSTIHDATSKEKEYLLIGDLICGARPVLDTSNKWYSPRYMYSGRVYPRYLSGTGYVLSMPTAHALYQAALRTHYFHLEDIYITGMCALRAVPRITPRDEPGFSYTGGGGACAVHSRLSAHRVTPYRMRRVSDLLKDVAYVDRCERLHLTQVRKKRLKPKQPTKKLPKVALSFM